MINICGVIGRISRIFAGSRAPKDISFFEVKELYNLAYEQKAQARNALRQYRRIEARARQMDAAYRQQLSHNMLRRAA